MNVINNIDQTNFASPWIQGNNSDDNWIAKYGEFIQYPQNSCVYAQGDFCNKFFYVKKGKVKINVLNEDGSELVLGIHEPGTFFGEPSAIDGEPCFASAITMSDTELYTLESSEIYNLLQTNPEIVSLVFRGLSRKIRVLAEQVINLSFHNAYTRVVKLLKHSIGNIRLNNDGIVIKLTHKEIAEMTGLYRVTVTNVIDELRKEGIINSKRGSIVILDGRKLNDL